MHNAKNIESLATWLRTHDDIVVMGHVQPDGDAAGSVIATVLALRALGKRAYGSLPGGVSKMYAHFPQSACALAADAEAPFKARCAFCVDVSEKERLGEENLRLFEACEETAMLDHHATNSGFGDLYFVDGEAAATGELVVELIECMHVQFTKEMAIWLYVAISTDCGRFGFSNTRAQTMRAAATLLETGFDVARVCREVFATRSEARVRLTGLVLSGMQVSADGKMAWAKLTNAMLEQTGALPEDNEGLPNDLLSVQGVEFAALAQERGDGVKFSLRSKEWLDVANDVAAHFGGGGHSRAAGCFIKGSLDEALEKVLTLAQTKINEKE